MLYIYWI